MTNGDGTPADRASSLVRLVQSIVGTLRDRRNHPESTLALVTVGCWSIAVFAWESASKFGAMQHLAEKVAAGFVVISVLPLARLLWRLWALSSTTESPTRPVQPSAIKGLSSFGPQDGDLFLRLERTEELRTLVGHVKDDRTPLLVVVGESGSGKTSLV